MSSAVAELDAYLQSMLNLKPPGVSGTKIQTITALCTANIQSESVLVQKIYTHFKKAPSTHKLGVLYVVDSVTRQWVDQAKKSGHLPGGGASDGTFAAAVNRVTELLPVLMNDIINSAPEEQKEKIKKLVDIWDRSSTFPTAMLSSFKDKLNAPKIVQSTTPDGSPSPDIVPFGQQHANNPVQAASASQDTSAILEALKNMARQNVSAAPVAGPGHASMNHLLGAQNGIPQPNSTVNQGPSAVAGHAVNPLGALFAGLSNGAQSQSPANVPPNPLAAFLPQTQVSAPIPNAAPVAQDAQAQQFQLLQLMAAQGIPPDQWATALQLLNMQNTNAASGLPFPPPLPTNGWAGNNGASSRDRDAYTRSPPSQYRDRRRSRSPDVRGRRDPSPRRRRESPSYDQYRSQNDRDGRRGNDYRQRSPAGRQRRSPSPAGKEQPLPPPGPKHLVIDHNIPKGTIKVLSRTLFVGGVTSSESHLRSLFANYGIVQTCIVNVDKRHAFVKMVNRTDAVAARAGMEEYKAGDTQLRTKWGVGFGPRDCSDYQTGVSVIPIDRLTDADRKWMLTAEYGGTGGRQIESGMVVEEPDIEIGAGVSSKAMSRRIATDQGGKRGPQSSRVGNPGSGRRDDRRDDDRYGDDRNDRPTSSSNSNTNGAFVPPPLPGFGMSFPTLPNGMPMFPGGFPPFPFPQQQPNQKQE